MNNFSVLQRHRQPCAQPVSQGASDLPRRNQAHTSPLSQDASDLGKVVSSDRNNNARVRDIGETHFSRRPIGRDPTGLQKFRVGLLNKSAISVNGQQNVVRFKGFGFEDGKRGTINDRPLAIYQKGSLPNPFARVYRIDLELQQKGLENFNGFHLSNFAEIKTPFTPSNRASYSVLNEPYLYENETMHDSNFHTHWQKARPSVPRETLPRDPEVLMARVFNPLHRGAHTSMGFYHAASVKGVDLGEVQGLRDFRGHKYPRNFVIVPGRVDTDNITKLSSYAAWTHQEGDPGPVGVCKTWTFKLASKVETQQTAERLIADNEQLRQRSQAALLREQVNCRTSTPPQTRKEFLAHWNAWAAEGTEDQNRKEAVARLTRFPNGPRGKNLCLDGLGLTSLPQYLPPGIESLDVSKNRLTSLSELPAGLKGLNVWRNELTVLPALPAGLKHLVCGENRLTVLPDLPTGMTSLEASHNQLTALPKLPAGITSLQASHNQLTALPKLPARLEVLFVNDNQLTALPELPAGLKYLRVQNNQLTMLPELPLGLEEFNASSNPLTRPPANIMRRW